VVNGVATPEAAYKTALDKINATIF
jgi:hypothetical protein